MTRSERRPPAGRATILSSSSACRFSMMVSTGRSIRTCVMVELGLPARYQIKDSGSLYWSAFNALKAQTSSQVSNHIIEKLRGITIGDLYWTIEVDLRNG